MSLSRVMDKILKGKLWDFHGGIHPDEHKHESTQTPLSSAALPPILILPLKQHVGSSAEISVRVGDKVLTGQPLTRPASRMQTPIHAPTSGEVVAIEPHTVAHPSGLSEICIHIRPDGEDRWRDRFPLTNFTEHAPVDLVSRIHDAGIVGLGGAGFPTDVKLATGREKIELLIINGAECEPYISCDDRLMRDEAARIAEGIEVLRHILKPKLTLIAIEDNKPEAIAAMQAVVDGEAVQVRVIPTKYPSGAARQLIEILTGKQVPSGKRSLSLGVVMFNVGTTFAIRQAILEDEPLIRRVVTLTGERFGRPGNVWVRIGTSVRWLLGQYELRPEPRQRIIMGGPMMGFTLPHADVPIVKISNCIMAPSAAELEPGDDERNCIRCGECASVCPVNLLPQQLYWFSKAGEHDKAREHQLDDCIECGACAWVCPSHIPLVHYYRIEKAEQQRLAIEAEQAERAKQRFAAKKARLEQERLEREAKHQEMIKARQAQMASQPAGEDPVAAAIARVKARQQQAVMEPTPIGTTVAPQQSSGNEDARKAAIAAAIARAKAKATPEAQAQSQAITPSQIASEQPPAGDEAKRAAVAAAIARAKAKKAQTPAEPAANLSTPLSAPEADAPNAKDAARKAAVAAAIARAKAKKAQTQAEPVADLSTPVSVPEADASSDKDDARKAAVAAAIARAKARKAQAAEAGQTNSPDPEKSE